VGERVRPWPDERHVALQDIDELGQLIEARPAQDFADASHARIISARLSNDRPVLEDHHRPELEDDKFPAVEAAPSLPEQNWAEAIERNGNRTIAKSGQRHAIAIMLPMASGARFAAR
jgi:hypothetical protein